jgi:hypothetical protein
MFAKTDRHPCLTVYSKKNFRLCVFSEYIWSTLKQFMERTGIPKKKSFHTKHKARNSLTIQLETTLTFF